jgi:hypothetical protein
MVERSGDVAVARLCLGQYWTVVQTSSGAGLASTLRSERHIHGEQPVRDAGRLHMRAAAQLAGLLKSRSAPEASVGLATVNAVVNPEADGLVESRAVEVLRERAAGRALAMVGRFPFADQLEQTVSRLWIFERGIGRRSEDHGEDEMPEVLPRADVVAITATTLMNGTLPRILAAVRSDAFLMMLGPSTPMTPVLFDLGFDVLCGTVVEDVERVILAVEQGAVTSQIPGVRRVALWNDRDRR